MTISILGAGWLGLPLVKRLIAQQHTVKASTTSAEKLELVESAGAQAFLLSISADGFIGDNLDDFFEADTLIISLPPKRQMQGLEQIYPEQINRILEKVRASGTIKKLIFWSSIGIYGDKLNGVVTESDLDSSQPASLAFEDGNRALLLAEHQLAQFISPSLQTIVLRLGGLIGHGRQAGRFFANKTNVPNGQQCINLVQGDDVLDITVLLLEQNLNKAYSIFNIVADEHPTRSEFYTVAAEKIGLPVPSFIQESGTGKIVSNTAIKTLLNYQFRTLTP